MDFFSSAVESPASKGIPRVYNTTVAEYNASSSAYNAHEIRRFRLKTVVLLASNKFPICRGPAIESKITANIDSSLYINLIADSEMRLLIGLPPK